MDALGEDRDDDDLQVPVPQLCTSTTPTPLEWHLICYTLPRSDVDAFNYISRLGQPPLASGTGSWFDALDLAGCPSHPELATNKGNDHADSVDCPVPFDLVICRLPLPIVDVPFSRVAVSGQPAFDVYHGTIRDALTVDRCQSHPGSKEMVMPAWAAYLPNILETFDGIVSEASRRKQDLIFTKCLAREFVFALARRRAFQPVTPVVMHLITGLCYYIAAVRVAAVGIGYEQGIAAMETAAAAVAAIPKTPVDTGATISKHQPPRKARTPPAPASKIRTATAGGGGGVPRDRAWNLPMEWNDHILPFTLYRFLATQRCYASAAHWLHYESTFAWLDSYIVGNRITQFPAYLLFMHSTAELVRRYRTWDNEYEHNTKVTVIKCAWEATNAAFKQRYLREKFSETLDAYSQEDVALSTAWMECPQGHFDDRIPKDPRVSARLASAPFITMRVVTESATPAPSIAQKIERPQKTTAAAAKVTTTETSTTTITTITTTDERQKKPRKKRARHFVVAENGRIVEQDQGAKTT